MMLILGFEFLKDFGKYFDKWNDIISRWIQLISDYLKQDNAIKYEASKPYLIVLFWLGIAISLGSYLTRIVWCKWVQPQPKPAEGEDEEQLPNPFHPREWEVLAIVVGIVEILFLSHISFDFLGVGAGISFFFWSVTFGLRAALKQLSLPRKPNLLVDLPDYIGQAFVTSPWELGAFLGALISLHIGGSLKFWTTLKLYFGGYLCGWIPTWFLTLKWLWRQSPISVGILSRNLRRSIGWRSEALAILEVYANVEPKDYANLEILTRRLQGRLGWLISQEPRYSLALADALEGVGNFSDCANLFEAILGIEEATYQIPEELAEKVQNLTATLPSDVGAKYIVSLAIPLVAIGFPERGLAVLNAYFGLSSQDYTDPHDLVRILREQSQSLPEDLGYEMILTLAGLLLVFEPAYGVCLLEAYLGVPGGDYTDPSASAITVAQLKQLPEEVQFKFGMFLVAALNNNERSTEAGALLAKWFELKNEPEDIVRVQSILKPLPKKERANILQLLASYWNNSGRHQDSLTLLESYLNLKPRDYSSPRRLRERLQSLSPSVTSAYLFQLSNALSLNNQGESHFCTLHFKLCLENLALPLVFLIYLQKWDAPNHHRYEDARRLWESYLWIDFKQYRHLKKLGQTLDDRLQYLPIEMQFSLVSQYAYRLRNVGRYYEALLLLQAHLHISSFSAPDLKQLFQLLSSKLQGVSPTVASRYLETLATVLEGRERSEIAAFVLEIWLQGWAYPYANSIDPSAFCSLFVLWLDYFGKNSDRDDDEVFEICRALIPQLRRTLVETAVTLEDRSRFIKTTASLRQRVVETGLYQLQRDTDPIQSAKSKLEVLLWDFELSQRILLERF